MSWRGAVVMLGLLATAGRAGAVPVAQDLAVTTAAGVPVTITLHATNPLDAALEFALEEN
jgi:hypothetical protein